MAVDQARVAAALPDYDVGDELGRGGFGVVLAGRHKLIHRDVAVKVLHEDASGIEDVRERFLVEARLLAGFDHPHVVRVYDYVERDGLCLLVMEKLTGGSLRRRFTGGPDGQQQRDHDLSAPPEARTTGGPSQLAACAIGLSAATALAAAHARGILHRDVKPDNLLFTDAGLPKMTDFGIAKILEATATTTTGLVGTPRYMAPEQITGDRLSPATDLYALGLVIYELLAGRPPFDRHLTVPAMLYHHLNVPPARLTEAPDPVATVIGRALEKNPPARHASAQEFAIDLALAAAGAYGPGWLTASEVPTSLPEAVTEAARGNAAVATRSPVYPRPAGATATPPWWSASGVDTGTATT
ncbi:serine/threonine-protein kinase, partial [Protofrankia symbiont of Coriaria ruscifolia]|uniref:serine/threonine-protein kinase n=1 Tax=Protofrankia symbiont of Coriaria ruscifolia TaxID=1306542 RepID=UPI0010417238